MNKIMKYKGYWARVRYSEPDKCFWGKLEGMKNNSVSFEQDFRDAIDLHLEICEEDGRIPERQSIKCPKYRRQLVPQRQLMSKNI